MPVRQTPAQRGERRGRDELHRILREVDEARTSGGLSYRAVARVVGLSGSQVARILRGELPDVGVVRVAQLLAVVGLELSARAHPVSAPVRDAGSQALLARFRARLAPTLRCRTEVPVIQLPTPGPVDLRAWDLAVDGPTRSARVDAETRLGDVQALQRRFALKQRDSSVEVAILLVADTRHNRLVVRATEASLREQFPIPARRALASLARGEVPEGNALILL